MDNDLTAYIEKYAGALPSPDFYFSGRRLPHDFCFPDNILIFYKRTAFYPVNVNTRCTLVLPLDPMVYYVDGRRIELAPGTVLYIAPYATRFLSAEHNGYRRLLITFDLAKPTTCEQLKGLNMIPTVAWDVLRSFLNVYQNGSTEACAANLVLFLQAIEPATSNSEAEVRLSRHLDEALSYINNHLASDLSIKTIANHISISESHLRALFRQEFSMSIGRYIAHKRLEAAKHRLLNTNAPMAEVALLCGFANVFVFGAFFKKHAGIPPARFRKLHPEQSGSDTFSKAGREYDLGF